MTRTPEQQRAIVDRILAAWLRMPDLRFGQLVTAAADRAEHDPFYVRDEALCEAVEALAAPPPPPPLPSEIQQIQLVAAALCDQRFCCIGRGVDQPELRGVCEAAANESAMALARITDGLSALVGWRVAFSFTDDYPSQASATVDGLPLDTTCLVPGSAATLLLRCQVPDEIAARFSWWPAPSSTTVPRC